MTETSFDAALAGQRRVVLFHATWCPFCRMFLPVFRANATGMTGWEPLEVVLDDEEDPLYARFGIDVVPTVIRFDDGAVVDRVNGRPYVGLTAKDLEALGASVAPGSPGNARSPVRTRRRG